MIRSIIDVILSFLRKIRDDYISAFSAQAAFFIIISFFPFIMFLLSLLQFLPLNEGTLVTAVAEFFPASINETMISIIYDLYSKTSGTILSVTLITALWSAGKGFFSIIKGLNGVYRIKESRNYFVLRGLSVLYTLVFSILILISLGILVFGNRLSIWIQARFPLMSDLALGIISLRTVVGLCVLIVFFLALYIAIPNRRTKLMSELPGAIVAAAGWMGFSYIYSYYIDHMGKFSYMYGSLTAIVFCMLWVYFCMYLMFMGAELNVVLQNKEMLHDFQNLKKEFEQTKNEKLKH